MRGKRIWRVLAVTALGASPLATVSTCDYGPGGGYLAYDQGVGVIVDDGYYVDDCCGGYYYDDYYYDEYYYYDDDDDDDD